MSCFSFLGLHGRGLYKNTAEGDEQFASDPRALELWAKGICLWEPLASSFDNQAGINGMISMTDDEMKKNLGKFCDKAKALIIRSVKGLRESVSKTHTSESINASTKFSTFKASAGTVDNFHDGVIERVGKSLINPCLCNRMTLLRAGRPWLRISEGMEREHCSMKGSECEFESSNYHVKTTPRNEWQIAKLQRECVDTKGGRRIPNYKQCVELPEAKDAGLTEDEVVAVILYTGPMVCFCAYLLLFLV